MTRHPGYAAVLAALAGCTDAADVDVDDTDTAAAPDLAGTYALVLEPDAACPGDLDWAGDTLVVTGTADALTFDFGDVAFAGEVDTAFAVSFGGIATLADASLDVDATGIAYTDENDRWVLDGSLDLTATVVDSSCSTTATFLATQGS